IDGRQPVQYRRPSLGVVDGTVAALESMDARIAVQTDDKQVRLGASLAQVLNMADVQHVEAAVGERDALAQSSPAVQLIPQRRPIEQFLQARPVTAAEGAGTEQVAEDLVARDRGDADLLDLQSAGDVGQADR